MPRDPFLMKKLLKSVVCGTRKQCTGEKSKGYGWEKKKKNLKRKYASRKRKTHFPNAP